MAFNRLAGVAVVVVLGGASNADAAPIVLNGGFEMPLIVTPPVDLNVNPTGWIGTGDLTEQGYFGAVDSGDGNQWFDLNPGFLAGTGISQDISLRAGRTYTFSFLYNGNNIVTPPYDKTTEIAFLIASLAGTLVSGSVFTGDMLVYAPIRTPWRTFSRTFTPASGGVYTLSFTPNGEYAGGFIDRVQVVAEPMTLSLMGVSLIGLALRRHRIPK